MAKKELLFLIEKLEKENDESVLKYHKMQDYNSTVNNVIMEVDWANKKAWFSLPMDKESIFAKIIISSLFVFISYMIGWVYGIAYLTVVILLDKIENKKMGNFFSGLLKLSNNNSSQFSQNFMLSPQNQNFQYFPSSPWSNVKEVTPQETFELGAKPQYVYVDIHGAEVAELRSRIEKLEERRTQQVIGIQNLDSDKLELKVALVVTIESTEQDGFVVWSEDLNIYGEGKSEGEARSDFLKNVEELYFDLKQDRDKLGPAMERIWKFLQKAIKEV